MQVPAMTVRVSVETLLTISIQDGVGQRYVFRMDGSEASVDALVRQVSEFTTDPDLAFDICDGLAVVRGLDWLQRQLSA
jgi:hypothetical protein